MKYNKLVRDKIPRLIKEGGGEPMTHVAGKKEYWEKLKEKLKEEVEEFLKEETREELVDVLEVVDAICEYKKVPKGVILKIQKKKADERGRFKKRIILDKA
jgi:predicted house-cleaning noncanonical NTP pyrophosphatase (MazG superfamily)